MKKLSSERQRLAAEVKMKREMEQQYAKRCTLQVQSRFVRVAQDYEPSVRAQCLLANRPAGVQHEKLCPVVHSLGFLPKAVNSALSALTDKL